MTPVVAYGGPARAAAAAAVRELALLARPSAADLADRLVALVEAGVGYAGGGAEPPPEGSVTREDLHASCHTNIASLLDGLATPPPLPPQVWAAPQATGRRRAEQGVPLDLVLHSYRLGARVVWDELVRLARGSASAPDPDALLDGATVVWDLVDRFSTAVADAYRETRAAAVRTDELRKDELLGGLLEGRASEPGFATEATAALGLPSSGRFCVVLATVPMRAQQPLAVRGLRSAWRSGPAAAQAGVVALGDHPLADVLAVLSELAEGAVGVSPDVDGLAALPTALHAASLALRTVLPGERAVVALDERLPQALLAARPDLAGRLAERVLGPLLRLPADEREVLLDTMQAWWAAGGSAGQAAAALYCHRNTVLNRLRRVSELTGRSLTHPHEQAAWVLAVSAARMPPPP